MATQEEVNYRRGLGPRQCGKCLNYNIGLRHFMYGRCLLVDGDITPYGTCDYVQPMRNPFATGRPFDMQPPIGGLGQRWDAT
jgi:hypothetical protein